MSSNVQLGAESIGVEHSVAGGNAITGELSAGAYTWDIDRGVAVFPELASAGEGLIDLRDFKRNGTTYCTFVQVICDAGLSWSVSLTSGLGDGSATEVDDPAYDMELASDSGSAVVRINQECLPTQLLRFTAAAGASPTKVIAMICKTNGSGGRLIS